MLFDDAVDDGESQAGPFSQLLGGEERLEQPFAGDFIHSGAVVGYGDEGVFARFAVAMGLDEVSAYLDQRGLDAEHPPMRHGIPRIGRQVHQHLFDLPAVGMYRQHILMDYRLESDILTDDAFQKLFDLLDDLVKVDRLRIDDLFSAEGEQASGQVGGPVGSGKYMVQVLSLRVVLVHMHLYQVN